MTVTTEIKRLQNGSIDLDHYVRIGRALHGQAVRKSVKGLITTPDKLAARALRRFVRRRSRVTAWSDFSLTD